MIPGRLTRAAHAAALACLAIVVAWLAAAFPASAGARDARAAILPPGNPRYSLGVGEYLPGSCAGVRDFSSACMTDSLGMINAGRRSEALAPLQLPANWQSLTVAQQLFVLTALERTARGLPADGGLSASLNSAAVSGADAGTDPSGGASGLDALWAGGEPNAIVVVADWMYEDGLFRSGFSENLNCSSATLSGCWQHRDILLHDGVSGSCGQTCAVGAGYSSSGYSGAAAAGTGSDSYAEVFARGGSGSESFTWAAERKALPPCEQTGDSCAWKGSPVATTSGIKAVGATHTAAPTHTHAPTATDAPTHSHAPITTKPWFSTAVTSRVTARGRVSLRIHVGIRLFRVSVVARHGRRHITLRVRRLSRHWYRAVGRLAGGTWTARIRYRTTRRSRRRPTSQMRVTVL